MHLSINSMPDLVPKMMQKSWETVLEHLLLLRCQNTWIPVGDNR